MENDLALHIGENLRAGVSPEEARRQAILRLGGLERTKEIYRDQQGLPVLETLFQDVRYGLRILRKNPGFTAVLVRALWLAVGGHSSPFFVGACGVVVPRLLQDMRD